MKKIKWVQQEDEAGCAVACCAMITGKTYAQIKDEMVYLYHGGVYQKHLDAYLFEQGYFIRRLYHWNVVAAIARQWPALPAPLCIACVVANAESDAFHYVVVYNDVVYDPATISIKHLSEYVRVEWVAGITKPRERKKCRSTNTNAPTAATASSE